jgi:hypothetical protein
LGDTKSTQWGAGREGSWEGEKSKVKVGKKKETVGTFLFQIKTARGPWTCENFLIDGLIDGIKLNQPRALLVPNHFLPPTTSCLHSRRRRIFFWVDLVSPAALNLVFNVSFTDFGVSNVIPLTAII